MGDSYPYPSRTGVEIRRMMAYLGGGNEGQRTSLGRGAT